MKLKPILLLNTATLLWALNVVTGRMLKGYAGPFTITGFRAFIAGACFLLLWPKWRWKKGEGPTGREFLLLLAMGLSGVAGFQVLQYAGLRLTTAANAGLVNATNPVITLLLARLLLKAPITPLKAGGALISLAGVFYLLTDGHPFSSKIAINPGDLLVLAAVVCWGVYTIVGKILLDRRDTVWVTSLSTLFALPFLVIPFAWEVAVSPPVWSAKLLLAFLFIGVGPAFTAFLAWNEGVKMMGPNAATVFINTMALYAAVLSALIVGEPPGVPALIGGALIILGCTAALWQNNQNSLGGETK